MGIPCTIDLFWVTSLRQTYGMILIYKSAHKGKTDYTIKTIDVSLLILLKGFLPPPIQSNLGCLEMSQCIVGWFCGVLSWLKEGMISNVGQSHPTSIWVCVLRQCLCSKTIKLLLLSICINVLLTRWRHCIIDFPLIHVYSDHRPKPTRLLCRITVQVILVDVCARAHANARANFGLGKINLNYYHSLPSCKKQHLVISNDQ